MGEKTASRPRGTRWRGHGLGSRSGALTSSAAGDAQSCLTGRPGGQKLSRARPALSRTGWGRATVDDDRRGVLKKMLALGVAAPLAGAWSRTRVTKTQATLTSQQLAGQRVVFSYPGLTVPAALLQQVSAGQAAGVIFFGGDISRE